MFRYLGVDRSSGLFKFFIQNFGKPSEEGKRRGGVEGGDVIPYPSRRQTRSSKAVIITIAIIAIISRREEGNDWHATLVRGSQKRNGNVTSCAIKLTVSPTAANPGNVYIRMDPSGADYMQFAHRRHNVKIAWSHYNNPRAMLSSWLQAWLAPISAYRSRANTLLLLTSVDRC